MADERESRALRIEREKAAIQEILAVAKKRKLTYGQVEGMMRAKLSPETCEEVTQITQKSAGLSVAELIHQLGELIAGGEFLGGT